MLKDHTISNVSFEVHSRIIARKSVGRRAPAKDEWLCRCVCQHPTLRPGLTSFTASYHSQVAVDHSRAALLGNCCCRVVCWFGLTALQTGLSEERSGTLDDRATYVARRGLMVTGSTLIVSLNLYRTGSERGVANPFSHQPTGRRPASATQSCLSRSLHRPMNRVAISGRNGCHQIRCQR